MYTCMRVDMHMHVHMPLTQLVLLLCCCCSYFRFCYGACCFSLLQLSILLLTSWLLFGLEFGALRAAEAGAAVLVGLLCLVGLAGHFLSSFLLVLPLSSFLSLALLPALLCCSAACCCGCFLVVGVCLLLVSRCFFAA